MVSCEFNSHWRQLYFLLKLFKTLNANFVQKCQICVIYENLDYLNHSTTFATREKFLGQLKGFTEPVHHHHLQLGTSGTGNLNIQNILQTFVIKFKLKLLFVVYYVELELLLVARQVHLIVRNGSGSFPAILIGLLTF